MQSEVEKIQEWAEPVLDKLGFVRIKTWDGGMFKEFEWSNGQFIFALIYDRGYYDCRLRTLTNPQQSYDLIWLLRLLKGDRKYCEKELEEANLWNTLSIQAYVELFTLQHDLILRYMTDIDFDLKGKYATFIKT